MNRTPNTDGQHDSAGETQLRDAVRREVRAARRLTVDRLLATREAAAKAERRGQVRVAARLALVRPMRLLALAGRGPSTVEELTYRHVEEAAAAAVVLLCDGRLAELPASRPLARPQAAARRSSARASTRMTSRGG